jgi:PAS domain S-box-containing protein
MPPLPPPASGAQERSPQPSFRELSRTFWRGVSSVQSLGPAIESVLHEFNTHVGTRRASVWLHDRRARELSLVASSDPSYGASTSRIAVGDSEMPAARGLRLESAQILEDVAEPILISPLRGLRRALGTLVIEGPPSRPIDDQQRLELATELGRQLSTGIENVQLLDEMLRQRRLLEDTFNSLHDLVVVTDRAGRIVQMNDALAIRLARSRADLLERSLADLVGSDVADWAAGSDSDETGMRTRTLEHERLGGTFDLTVTPLINEDGEPVGTVIVARDITRQVKLEAEQEALRARLAQSEKLASLGQFVAGIAHEINNPLQGVLGHLELLITPAPPAVPGSAAPNGIARPVRQELRRIYHEAHRAAKIVQNLLTFTGSQLKNRRRLRVDHVLTRALASRRASLTRAGIEIVRQHGEELPQINGDPMLLQQAFLNVLINAEHAIADTKQPGTISITTAPSERRPGVTTTIRDTGPGIGASVLPRIFDPFFTTKEVGQGTGLGLAITYGIIQEHGGTIEADNAPDGGAVFTIDLPAAKKL